MAISFGVHAGPHDLPLDELRAFWRTMDQSGVDWFSARYLAWALRKYFGLGRIVTDDDPVPE